MSAVRRHFNLARVIGHRGLAAEAPENSLAGLRTAASRGFEWCEIDVQSSRDGVPVMHHDFDLGGPDCIAVAESSVKDLTRTVVGCDPSTGRTEHLPTFAAALRLADELALSGLVVEVKSRATAAYELANATAAAVVLGSYDGRLKLIGTSFNRGVLTHLARLLPELPLALNCSGYPQSMPVFVNNIHINWPAATASTVRQATQAGLGLYAYTVNQPDVARRLIAMGVAGLFTDRSSLLA